MHHGAGQWDLRMLNRLKVTAEQRLIFGGYEYKNPDVFKVQ
jgi:hypothetical protein